MLSATGPWRHPPDLPEDPKKLCLVVLDHKKYGRTYHVMRYLRKNWQFPEGLALSGNERVLGWAYIHKDIGIAERPAERSTASEVAPGNK